MINHNSDLFNGATCDICMDYAGHKPKYTHLDYDINSDQYFVCQRCYRIIMGAIPTNYKDITAVCRGVKKKLDIDYLEATAKAKKAQQEIDAKVALLKDMNNLKRKCQICHKVISRYDSCCDESDLYRDLEEV